MNSFLFGLGLNGLIFSLALAALAAAVQASGKRPMLSHLLWLLVLVKLLTPALVAVPGIALPSLEQVEGNTAHYGADAVMEAAAAGGELASMEVAMQSRIAASEALSSGGLGATGSSWIAVLAWIWLAGSATVFLWSIARMLQFQLALRRAAGPASTEVEQLADRLGQAFGLCANPRILIVDAQISPLVWWMGGRPQLVIPAALCQAGKAEELRWSLAHELGHIRRGDHLVRWLEWLAVVSFWWNPVTWWARRNLRINEEICCDRLVLATLQPNPKTYANSLLNVVEFLATPGLRPPAFASGMNSGDALETRLKMILKNTNPSSTPRWMRAMSLAAAVALLPLGFAQGQERERDARERSEASEQEPEHEHKITKKQYSAIAARLNAMVEAGEITPEDARRRLEGLRGQVAGQEEKEAESERRKQRSAREEYARVEKELKALVEAGRISEPDAKARLDGFRRSLSERTEKGESRGVTVEQYKRAAAELEKLVEAGRITRAQADERLIAMRRMIKETHQESEHVEKRGISVEEYKRAAADLRKLVEAGKVTPAHAEQRLLEMRKMIVDNPDDSGRREAARTSREEYYKRNSAELAKLVEAGKITPEQARVRLERMREEMAKSEAEEARAKAMNQEAEKIMQAVRNGKLSRQEAEKKLEAMRRGHVESSKQGEGQGDHDHADESAERGITLEQYRAIEARINGAIESVRISKEDGEKRKIEARKMIRDR
jgi:beta-lactamase regulating signal transducer with metallopeptidase domain/polyhydroxyalkanoate synthesis regulator phasin